MLYACVLADTDTLTANYLIYTEENGMFDVAFLACKNSSCQWNSSDRQKSTRQLNLTFRPYTEHISAIIQTRAVTHALAVIMGSFFLTLGSYIEIPILPVPVTMQTLSVTLVGAFYGWRLGGVTITAWLIEAALGLPVLAGGAGGPHHFLGPSAGYLLAFPIAGMLVGWLVERGWNGTRPLYAFLSMLYGHLICLTIGAAWLATIVNIDTAILHGISPFLLGFFLKSGMGAAILVLIARSRILSRFG